MEFPLFCNSIYFHHTVRKLVVFATTVIETNLARRRIPERRLESDNEYLVLRLTRCQQLNAQEEGNNSNGQLVKANEENLVPNFLSILRVVS